jgi:hypothetical protein
MRRSPWATTRAGAVVEVCGRADAGCQRSRSASHSAARISSARRTVSWVPLRPRAANGSWRSPACRRRRSASLPRHSRCRRSPAASLPLEGTRHVVGQADRHTPHTPIIALGGVLDSDVALRDRPTGLRYARRDGSSGHGARGLHACTAVLPGFEFSAPRLRRLVRTTFFSEAEGAGEGLISGSGKRNLGVGADERYPRIRAVPWGFRTWAAAGVPMRTR